MTDMITDRRAAFPFQANDPMNIPMQTSGMSLREYAAIKLRVPDSGTEWLDDMIRQAKRDEPGEQFIALDRADMYRRAKASTGGREE